MKDFKRGGSFGGGKKFGGDRGGNRGGSSFGGNRSRPSFGEDRPMHKAVCDDCGKTCEVPFRPTGDKPIFCNDCFSGKRDGDSKRDFGGDRGGNRGGNREFSKPSFSSAPRSDAGKDPRIDELKRQIDSMNTKLDTLMGMMKSAPAKEDKSTLKSVVAKATKESAPKKVTTKTATKKASASTKKAPAKKKAVTKKK